MAAAEGKQAKQQLLLERYEGMKAKFPAVQSIDARRLSEMIEEDRQQDGPSKLVLVDARTPQEQEVSMIPSRCTLTQTEFEARKAEFLDKTVVVYCTAGLRSGLYCAKLHTAGFPQDHVLNLEGSILAWALLDLPLVKRKALSQGSEEVPTRQVHTCLPEWGQYVSDDHEAVTSLSWASKMRLLLGWLLPSRR